MWYEHFPWLSGKLATVVAQNNVQCYLLPSVLSILIQIKVNSLTLRGRNDQLPKSTLNVLVCGYCDWRHQDKIDDVTFWSRRRKFMKEWLTEAKIVQSFDLRLHVIKKRGYVRDSVTLKVTNKERIVMINFAFVKRIFLSILQFCTSRSLLISYNRLIG